MIKIKLREEDKIWVRMAEDFSYLACQDILQYESIESQGERLTGTSNFVKFKGMSLLL